MDVLIKGMIINEIDKLKGFIANTNDERKKEQLQKRIDKLSEKVAIYDVSDRIFQNIR